MRRGDTITILALCMPLLVLAFMLAMMGVQLRHAHVAGPFAFAPHELTVEVDVSGMARPEDPSDEDVARAAEEAEHDENPYRDSSFGKADGKGYALNEAPGEEMLRARKGEEDQAWLSRDPSGPGRRMPPEPSMSTAIPGLGGDGRPKVDGAVNEALAERLGQKDEPLAPFGASAPPLKEMPAKAIPPAPRPVIVAIVPPPPPPPPIKPDPVGIAAKDPARERPREFQPRKQDRDDAVTKNTAATRPVKEPAAKATPSTMPVKQPVVVIASAQPVPAAPAAPAAKPTEAKAGKAQPPQRMAALPSKGGTGPAGPPVAPADPAPMSDSESDAFARIGSVDFRNGKVMARMGRDFKPVKPRITLKGELDLMSMMEPSVILRVSIDEAGKVIDVSNPPLRSSGSNEVDLPAIVAVYKWWIEPAKDKDGKPKRDVIILRLAWH